MIKRFQDSTYLLTYYVTDGCLYFPSTLVHVIKLYGCGIHIGMFDYKMITSAKNIN